ncbi:MAG: DedA family protein [Methanosarcinales archaeon]|nr:DedA family protein [Methanosarcinales archaeon]
MIDTIAIYCSLFFTSFLASTIIPLGSEGVVVYTIMKGHNIVSVVVIASIGNYLGACTTYILGYIGRQKTLEKYLKINQVDFARAEKLFTKYGSPVLLFTWLPIVGDALAAIGGIFKLNFLLFSIYVFTGKFIRYLAVAYFAGII